MILWNTTLQCLPIRYRKNASKIIIEYGNVDKSKPASSSSCATGFQNTVLQGNYQLSTSSQHLTHDPVLCWANKFWQLGYYKQGNLSGWPKCEARNCVQHVLSVLTHSESMISLPLKYYPCSCWHVIVRLSSVSQCWGQAKPHSKPWWL